MSHKDSCIACGTHLTLMSVCNVCKEYTTSICNKCDRMEDVTHLHTYCKFVYK